METHVLRQTVSSSVTFRLICSLVVLSMCTTAQELHLSSLVQVLANGPVVNAVCKATFPTGQTDYTIIWSVDGNDLFVNDLTIEYASPRYSVNYMEQSQNSSIYISTFSIVNAVKLDEGVYECLAQYIQDNNSLISTMDTIDLTIPQYLPAKNYPECTLNSSNEGFGKTVNLTCTVGESNPNVILRLTINRADGSEMQIGNVSHSGNASATVIVPVSGSLGTFVCTMTSSTFTTTNRICSVKFSPEEMPSTNAITILPTENKPTDSVGPITLLPEEKSSTNLVASSKFISTEHQESKTTLSPNLTLSPETQTTNLRASANAKSLLSSSIIGGAAASLLVVIILVVIVCIVIMKKSCFTKNSDPADRPSNTHLLDSINQSHITNDVNGYDEPPPPQPLAKQNSGTYAYADVSSIGSRPLSKPNILDKIEADGYKSPPKTGQTSVQDRGTYDYAYADVNKVGTSEVKKQSSTASYDYPDATPAKSGNYPHPTPDKSGKASNFPIYSQVNKSFKNEKSQKKADDETMVDNIVYVSAGPGRLE